MEAKSLKTSGFLGFLVPSQRFIGSVSVFLVPLSVFVLSQLPHAVLEPESLKTLGFLGFLVPSQRFIGSLLVFLVPLSVFVLSQLPHTVPESESLKTLFFLFFWYPLSVLLVPYPFFVYLSAFLWFRVVDDKSYRSLLPSAFNICPRRDMKNKSLMDLRAYFLLFSQN